MKKAVKGTYGYLKAKRTRVLIRTLLFFAISLAIFAAGYITTGSRKNLFTIVAVLGCLPACKSLVNLIMFFRAKGCSAEAVKQIRPVEGHLVGMYDMFFTSYQNNFSISHMVVENKIILSYTEAEDFHDKEFKDHLTTMLKQGGIKDMAVTTTNDIKKYCEQLDGLNAMNQKYDPKRDDEVRIVLYDISL